jgi:hypothetical protein
MTVFLLLIECILKSFFCIGLFSRRKEEEDQFDAALAMTLKTVDFAKERLPFAVFKPTGLGRFELYEKLEKRP